ncbi:MAG: DNA polymerase III subunit gamma/tau [Cyanophyceae cyanobacterium]
MSYEPLHHKYRPRTFAELVGQEAIATALTNAISSGRIVPAYLLTGPRGTGKTSSARILAKSLNCLTSERPTSTPCGQCEVCRAIARGTALDVIEIDAASNTGVDHIRELIERAQFAPVQCRYKVYVIDECHMLSTAAFNALLKTLEEPPPRVVFVLATTDPQRVLPTIISRCQRFDYRRIPTDAMVIHLRKIAQAENINISDEALFLVAQVANGGLRDAQSLLEQLSLLSGLVTPERIWDLVGFVPEQDLLALLAAIAQQDPEGILARCRSILNRGREPLVVLQNLANFYLNLLIAKTAPGQTELVTVTESTWQQLCAQAALWEFEAILRGQRVLKESEAQLKSTSQPRLWLEITLLELLSPSVILSEPSSSPLLASTPPPEPDQPQADVPPEPQLAPVTQPSPYCSSPPTAVATSELKSLWQQMLEQLHPPTTQALLSQHCYLLEFEGVVAVIGAKNKALLGIAQSKLTNIEAAFAAVCQHPITVKLRVAATSEVSWQPSQSPAGDPPTSEVKGEARLPQSQFNATIQASSSTPSAPPLSSMIESPTQTAAEAPAAVAESADEADIDEVRRAAESLAQCFDGELVSPDERAYSQPSPLEAAQRNQGTERSPAQSPLISGRPEIADLDDDIPF